MARLRERDLHLLLEVLREIYQPRNLEAFHRHAILALLVLVSADTICYDEIDSRQGRVDCIVEPDHGGFPRYRPAFDHHIHEHPVARHYFETRDGRAMKISDFLSRRQFHALGLYNEFYRRVGIEHQMAAVLPASAPLAIGVTLNRVRPDFTEPDRLCLDLLRPHLIQAYRNAEAVTLSEHELGLMACGFDKLRRGIVLLDSQRRVRLMSSGARQTLGEFFGEAALRNQRLPADLEQWVREQEGFLTVAGVPAPRQPLCIERGEKRLWVRLVADSNQKLLLLENEAEDLSPAVCQGLGLSKREAEVLAWVCQGKTNPEIAAILTLSVRTVEKHLEHILEELGVETRTAAARLALEILRSP
ncbi:MAG TPA: LuxR C-terminal-related transcriptional regulator [Terriglobia bacterium]|nr:LuxR C-terminal-related transcriptional regulator [Terriglobia bacterium]